MVHLRRIIDACLTCGRQRRGAARVARLGAEPEVSVEEPHEEGDLPRGGHQPEELLELRAVVPQEAREERDRLRPQDLLVGRREQELTTASAATGNETPARLRLLLTLKGDFLHGANFGSSW